jgi:DNA (cytosine-5)-methyltransferase 1
MPIRVGTDCSGLEAPIQALQNLGVPVKHVFSCDINKHVKTTILANHKPEKFYDDLCARDNATAPKSDLYVAGFPCQPFSAAGLKQGFEDLRGRGTVLFDICDYLEKQRPRAFVLENVVHILRHEGGETFKKVMATLSSIGKGAYTVSCERMNTRDHGVPHNRERAYFVGILSSHDKGTFEFPKPLPACPSIEQILEPRVKVALDDKLPPVTQTTCRRNVLVALKELRAKGHDPLKEPWIVEIDCTTPRLQYMLGTSPCITTRRGNGHWITNRGRRILKSELMRLQGMDMSKFKQAVSDTELGKQIGNAMSVNILERLLVRLLPAAGLVKGKLPDRWENAGRLGICALRPAALKSKATALQVAARSANLANRISERRATASSKRLSTRARREAAAAADRRRLGSTVEKRYRLARAGMLKARKALVPKRLRQSAPSVAAKRRRVA